MYLYFFKKSPEGCKAVGEKLECFFLKPGCMYVFVIKIPFHILGAIHDRIRNSIARIFFQNPVNMCICKATGF